MRYFILLDFQHLVLAFFLGLPVLPVTLGFSTAAALATRPR